ncbi:hypothetical protein TNCV_4929931 [Trichonephila clavipes]|nr:hypothetical protein TNCV_4929931 [Trichonephila clavipes]
MYATSAMVQNILLVRRGRGSKVQKFKLALFKMATDLTASMIYSQFGLAIHQNDQARRRFVEWAQNEIAVVPDFHKRILFLAMKRTSG